MFDWLVILVNSVVYGFEYSCLSLGCYFTCCYIWCDLVRGLFPVCLLAVC